MKNIICLFLGFLLISCSKNIDSSPPNGLPNPEEDVAINVSKKIVAHRGAWKEFGHPDNSVAALEEAIRLDILGSECDIQLTKDGQVIVFHDETINAKYIKDLSYEDINNSYKLSNKEEVPLLITFVQKIKDSRQTKQLWIDVKSLSDPAGGNAQSILAGLAASRLIKEAEAINNVKFIVGRKAVLDGISASVDNKWEIAYMNTAFSPSQFVNAGYSWANFSYDSFYKNGSFNQSLWDAYTNSGIKLSVYTVDDLDAARLFLKQRELFAISSNYPNSIKTQ